MKDWSTMAARGSLSIGLGLAVLLWPAPGLGGLVVLFGMYALLDGSLPLPGPFGSHGDR